MKLTVWGDAGGPGEISEERSSFGSFLGGHSYRELALELPEGGIEVDADHDEQRLGELAYAELRDRLQVVCVLDDDRLAPVLEERAVFFSPLMMMLGKGIDERSSYVARQAEVIGMSVTLDTARIGAQPLSWMRGDLRSSVDRFKWPCSWRSSNPLLSRAVDSLGGELRCRSAPATRIVDWRGAGYPVQMTPEERRRFEDWRRLPGGAERSLHPGRILSVR